MRRLIVDEGCRIRQVANVMGVARATVRGYVRANGWSVQPSVGGKPCQGNLNQPLLTRTLLLACQQGNGTWSEEFFEALGIRLLAVHDWVSDFVNQPINLLSYQELRAIAISIGNDPGPTVMSQEMQVSPARRYELFRAGTGIEFSYE